MIRRFAFILLPLLAACGGDGGERGKAVLNTIVISADSSVFLPSKGGWPLQPEVIAAAVSRGLVTLDSNGQVVPDLATSWRVSDDGLSIIFRLRKAKWSDGRAVTGEDFVRLFRSVMAPSSNHPFKPLLQSIENGEDVAAGRKPLTALGVDAPIPEVVEVRLAAPRPNMLQLLAHPAMGLADRNMSRFALGPFRYSERSHQGITLLPNPDFTDPGAVQIDEIRISAQSEASIALQKFKRDRASLLLGGTTGDFVLARGAALDRFLRLDPVRGIYGYRPLRLDGPLGDARIRQALAMTIDREALAASTGAGTASPIYGVLPWSLSDVPQPQSPAWAKLSLDARLADAQQLMLSARGAGAGKPLVLRVALPEGPGHAAILKQAASAWAPLGVTVEAVRADDRDADLSVVETVAPADSVAWFLHLYRCQPGAYCNPRVDQLIDQSSRAAAPALRGQLVRQAESLLIADQPIIPLLTPIRWSMVDPDVLGWTDNPAGQHPLAGLSVVNRQGVLSKIKP